MTDPSDALPLFQKSLIAGHIPLRRAALDKQLFVAKDEPNGHIRLTYMRLQKKTITAFVSFVAVDPLDGLPCFQVGYAVPESFRNQGRAKNILAASIEEMIHGLGRAGINDFYVEGIVGFDNLPSQRIAEQLLGGPPESITDSVSGRPALRYVRRVGNQKSKYSTKTPLE